MASHTNGEALPLLGLTRPQRIHYVDNLRASLTVLLIFHHAAVECTLSNLPMHIFININKAALWGLFFFVSGYSSTLALGSSTDLQFLVSRMVKIGLPAWVYAVIGHRLLFIVLTVLWSDVFGNTVPGWVYSLLSGPVVYVFYLLLMDCAHLGTRWWKREWPDSIPSVLTSVFRPSSQQQFYTSIELAAIALALYIFVSCLGIQIPLLSIYRFLSNDFPSFDAPVAYAIAYVVGVNFPQIQSDYMNITSSRGYGTLCISLLVSSSSLTIAQQLSTSLHQFIQLRDQYFFVNAGLNPHTAFYAIWCTFVFLTIPYSVVSIFSKSSWANREWGFLARHTYIQMYVNMIPILVTVHYTRWVGDVFLRVVVVGMIGVVVSWIGMLGALLLWMKVSPRLQRQT